jgi:virulence-associated protein VagC
MKKYKFCGYVKLEFNIQGYKDTATFLVMPMTDDYDIILGNDWAIARGAIFDFREKQLTVKRQGKDFILKPCRMSKTNKASLQYPEKDVDDDFNTTNPEQFVLNSAQAKRVVEEKAKELHNVGCRLPR